MPPLAGAFEPVRRVVLDSSDARPGDVYWAVTGRYFEGAALVENAFAHGALGAVASGRRIEPWAGKFTLEVEDANRALCRLAKCLVKNTGETCWLHAAEFDGRQLSAELARYELSLLEKVTLHLWRRWSASAA